MGGHGGLNILPQKRWNVYNYENREKVRRDEEAAAKEEQIKREEERKREAKSRLDKLRQLRGLSSQGSEPADEKPSSSSIETESKSECDSKHINLFEGIRIFDPIKPGEGKEDKRKGRFANDDNRNKKVKREEVRTVGPEDEKYKLGYGVAGKPHFNGTIYLFSHRQENNADVDEDEEYHNAKPKEKRKSSGKKTLEELRAERLKRERTEKERERALLMTKSKKDGGFSSRR
ncbi:hypothetical protein CDL12_06591 [Handroanthus impetiginosus]|uniref:CBF1-interacting co-repressor CIR N-terminal domain-containing protein n=1 Tax=Handroanthus impetiginosus TaxID=429701 RepID=A0A2G9HT89_9LAMI|nr:hypothetical protein CDL12_06591 [Handroanthus impetiginosus]